MKKDTLAYIHRRLIFCIFAILIFCSIYTGHCYAGANARTTIIIVRHAEKDTARLDPPLSTIGRHRAVSLASMFRKAGITAVYATQYIRTQQTAQPLCDSLHLKPIIIAVNRDSLHEYADTLASDIQVHHEGKVVLVVSHSNTIPLLLNSFGIREKIEIDDSDYDNIFVVTMQKGDRATLLRMRVEP